MCSTSAQTKAPATLSALLPALLLGAIARDTKTSDPGLCWTVPCPYKQNRCLPRAKSKQRYVINIGHQTRELTYPIISTSFADNIVPEIIWWQYDALPLTRELLAYAFPTARLYFGTTDAPRCLKTRSFRPQGTRGTFTAATGKAFRALVWRRCDISSRPPSAPLRVRIIDRPRGGGGSKNPCRLPGPHVGGRSLSNATIAALRSPLPAALRSAGAAEAPLEVVRLPERPDSLCDQVHSRGES